MPNYCTLLTTTKVLFPDVHARLVLGKNLKFNKVNVVKTYVEKEYAALGFSDLF